MPGPLSILPSRFWEGNDGNWSTFQFRIGNPGQAVRLLPATIGTTFQPVNVQGCYLPSNGIASDPTNCEDLRGGLFTPNVSATFASITCDGRPFCELPYNAAEEAIGYAAAAEVGNDAVLLGTGPSPPRVDQQIIAAYAEYMPLIGSFGLSGYRENVNSSLPEDARSSMLQTLRSKDAISNNYFAYTAGAHYRGEPAQWASLTLGGYDALRGNNDSSRLAVALSDDSTSDLIVSIRDIRVTSDLAVSSPNSAQVNSRVPELWLPPSACEVFERAFDLEWNSTVEYYLVNDTLHQQLLDLQRSVTFLLAADTTSSAVPIEVPYAAFDLQLSWPLANITDPSTKLRYFPLRRTNGTSILGRVFLQEAYLAVDYDKREFYLSQVNFPETPSDTRLVLPNGKVAGSDGLSVGAIVGIAVGIGVLVIILLALAFWIWRHRGQQRRKQERELQYAASGVLSRNSIAGTTINETPHHMEFFKADPPPGMEEHKPELDATGTARGINSYHRHELSAGSVRRTSQQTAISRTAVSPMSNRHTRSMSYGSSLGQPSPNLEQSPSPGHPSPTANDANPAWYGFSSSGPFHELHATEMAMRGEQVGSDGPVSDDLIDVAPTPGGSPPPAASAPAAPRLSATISFPDELRGPASPTHGQTG
ncbi:hypothetical protein CERZMDRAFT_100962 [Cercospora zeae-maydis SCOH1-5]|uniref:Peptidase A1 domain-containing protein n=1 Tax=Cercospora zeae-maydis SCOH1-5 TaxID=717836 RepID=A0A6A6F6K6_9PEZI|nr:hypothetical protein CERZMDRAFT_100962 [Cercospora zeae-maydis SCOH1-5]